MVERFRSKNMDIPVIVSKDRLSAAKACSFNDEIYYNLAETGEGFSEAPDGEDENREIPGKCLYGDTHPEVEKHKKIAILDDAFSALNIKKNRNIILIDDTVDIFAQYVIPAGILREPVSVLKYADVVIINKCSPGLRKNISGYLEAGIRRYNRSCPVFYSYYKPKGLLNYFGDAVRTEALEALKGKKIIAFCAIGNPGYFYDNLEGCGALVDISLEFEDHHDYTEKDVRNIMAALDKDSGYVAVSNLKD